MVGLNLLLIVIVCSRYNSYNIFDRSDKVFPDAYVKYGAGSTFVSSVGLTKEMLDLCRESGCKQLFMPTYSSMFASSRYHYLY